MNVFRTLPLCFKKENDTANKQTYKLFFLEGIAPLNVSLHTVSLIADLKKNLNRRTVTPARV